MKNSPNFPTLSYHLTRKKYIHMKNKENVTLDTFSVLNAAGWFLVTANIAGITQLSWVNIGTYFLTLLLIGLATSIIDPLVNNGGDKGGDK